MTLYLNGKRIPERLDDDVQHVYGSSNDSRLFFNTAETVDALFLGLPDAQNVFVIAETGDRAFDFAHGAQVNPTLFIHSAAQNATQWFGITHNQTDAIITTGAGDLELSPTSGRVKVLDDSSYVLGTGEDTFLTWETADVDAHYLNIVVTGVSRNIIISEDRNIDWGHAAQANPTLWIHSADSTDLNDYISIAHDQTDVQFNTGTGGFNFSQSPHVPDDIAIRFGNATVGGADAFLIWETADADANMLHLVLPTAAAPNVPVLAIGDFSLFGTDQGPGPAGLTFSAITAPTLMLFSADQVGLIAFSMSTTQAEIATNEGPFAFIGVGGSATEIKLQTGVATDSPKLSFFQTTTERAFLLYNDTGDIFTIDADGRIELAPNNIVQASFRNQAIVFTNTATTSGVVTGFTFTGGTDTGITAATEKISVDFDLDATKTWAAGAGPLATQREVFFRAPTYAGDVAGALTISQASTVAIEGAPIAGANLTITNPYALTLLSGNMRLNSGLIEWGDTVAAGSASTRYQIYRTATPSLTYQTPTGVRHQFTSGAVNMLEMSDSGIVFNEGSADFDIRMESNDNANMFVLDAGTNGVGIGQATTAGVVLIAGWSAATMGAGTTAARHFQTSGNITELAGAAITDIVGAYFNTFTITDGGGAETVGLVSTVYIAGAPTAGTAPTNGPYALFIDAGESRFDGNLEFGAGVAITAGDYMIGRDADGTNQFHFNTPTGAGFEWSINDVAISVWAANSFTFEDSTSVNGINFVTASTATQQIRTISTTDGAIQFQTQTFTAGGSHLAVQVNPTWVAENFLHNALSISATQNGANTNVLRGLAITLTKATVATTLDTATGIVITALGVTGTVTNAAGLLINNQSSAGGTTAYAIDIASQTANATTTRAIEIEGTGVNNAIRLGSSPNIYSSGAEVIRFADSTDGGGLSFTLTAAGDQAVNTIDTGDNSLILQSQTFTAGSQHEAVQLSPTWATENFAHTALSMQVSQTGGNTNTLTGISLTMRKLTGATTLTNMEGIVIGVPTFVGTITNVNGLRIADVSPAGGTTSYALNIQSQTANATTTRAVLIAGTGANNAIELGDSPLIYSSGAEVIRFDDSTAARGISFTLTAAGVQTIGTSAGNLTLSPTAANVAIAANVDVDMSAGGRLFGGGIQANKQDLAANTNLTLDENDSVVNVTSGAVSTNTITLPTASGNEGMIVSVYLVTDGGQNAVISRAGADVIQNGSADLANTTVTLDDAGDFCMLQCVNNSMWQILVNSGGAVA